jgi:hypothetical protein
MKLLPDNTTVFLGLLFLSLIFVLVNVGLSFVNK